MCDRDAFMKMMGITKEDVLDPTEKIKLFPLENDKGDRGGAAAAAGVGERSRDGYKTFSGLTASSTFSSSSSPKGEAGYSVPHSLGREGATSTKYTPTSSSSHSPLLSVSPSPFRNVSEALAGAKQAVRKMAQEENFCVRSPHGDHSDGRGLQTHPPTHTFPSGGIGCRNVEHSTFGEGKGKGNSANSSFMSTPMGRNGVHHDMNNSGVPMTSGFQMGNGASSVSPSPQNKIQEAEACKTKGNDAFEKGDFLKAIQHYTSGIDILEQSSRMEAKLRSGGVSEEAIHFHTSGGEKGDQLKFDALLFGGSGRGGGGAGAEDTILLAALYSNRSASYLQGSKLLPTGVESAYDHSLFDADRAVSLRPNWFKGYSRQGDCYFKMQRYHQAVESYAMAVSLDPGNARLIHSLTEAKDRAKAGSREEWKARRARRGRASDEGRSSAFLCTTTSGGKGEEEDASTLLRGSRRLRNTLDSDPISAFGSMNASPLTPSGSSTSGTSFHQDAHGTEGLFAGTTGTSKGMRTRGLWESLKKEVEQATQSPTGEGYRQAQLEKYRMQRSGGGRASSLNSSTFTGGSSSPPASWSAGPRRPVGRGEGGEGNPGKSSEELPSSSDLLPPTSLSGSVNLNSSYLGTSGGGLSSIHVPPEYSTAAAMSYQQKLLESFRQKRKQA